MLCCPSCQAPTESADGMKINLPNQITILRLIMAIIFFVCLAPYRYGTSIVALLDAAAILFFVAAWTDVLDGYLARKHNQITSFGRIIDPFVDKILVIGAYIFLAGDGFTAPGGQRISYVEPWMV